jgi:hypothetical protein
MARVSTDAPRSAGKHLNNDEHAFGLLRDSSGWLTGFNELRARLEEDGYLYFNGFFARDMVTFGMTLVHASLDNQTNQIRLSSDSRYQLAAEPVDDRWIGPSPAGHTRAGKRGRIC